MLPTKPVSPDQIQSNLQTQYAVISPVKDEADYIEMTISSMLAQTILPVVWIIVNDGSHDNTQAIVEKYTQENPWIKLVNRQDMGIRKRGKGVVEAFYTGYKTLTGPYDFIVKMDGDVTFGQNYFEAILKRFAADPRLGIAGGGLYEKTNGHTFVLNTVREHVRGCTKIYRRTCFEEIGGLVSAMGWDGIDEWQALSKNWKVQSFLEEKIYHLRLTGKATGFLKSNIEQGSGAYCMGYHPLFIIARGIRRITDPPFLLSGAAMIGGYFSAWLQHKELLADPSVIRYVRKAQLSILTDMVTGKQRSGEIVK